MIFIIPSCLLSSLTSYFPTLRFNFAFYMCMEHGMCYTRAGGDGWIHNLLWFHIHSNQYHFGTTTLMSWHSETNLIVRLQKSLEPNFAQFWHLTLLNPTQIGWKYLAAQTIIVWHVSQIDVYSITDLQLVHLWFFYQEPYCNL